ncbi:amino acid adenylation domain-containing protein [Chitinophaga oryziterrae]|uniref:Amino acid adenylation domain-containing protein n=1 Tax=Chitinophaga oryziterrae TaxID=1031224 RepID=A0A6N8JLA8_9BACT|nr:non-ribosomal peptide synthetase [Chitinophaga oryziterrae]MVT45199.1 amino acid adenylation domain-containing protein [Chitinophaga oryziterrae]
MNTAWNSAIALLLSAKENSIDIILDENRLQLKVPRGKVVSPQLLREIKDQEKQLIDFLRNEHAVTSRQKIMPVDSNGITHIPLSYSQERLWFLDQYGEHRQYHMHWTFSVQGKLDIIALGISFKEILRRHEILRTVIRDNAGVAYQEVMDAEAWEMIYITDRKEIDIQQYIADVLAGSFDLSRDYPLRVMLIQRSAEECLLNIVIHHIAFDGWSIGLMIKELTALYNARINNEQAILPELSVQYKDYAYWQRQLIEEQYYEKMTAFWKNSLSEVTPLDIFTDYARPLEPGVAGGVVKKELGKELATGLQQLAVKENVTLFMLLLTVFKVQLYRYSGQSLICVGTPVAGREQPEVEHLIGFFVNTIALCTDMSRDLSFNQLLQQVKLVTAEAFSYQDMPFEKVVELLGVERTVSHNPVFQVMFSTQKESLHDVAAFGDARFLAIENKDTTAIVDLHLNVHTAATGITISLTYNKDLYKEDTALRMLEHYETLLTSAIADPAIKVSDLKLLSAQEEQLVLTAFNNTDTDFPAGKTLPELIAEIAESMPEKTALVAGNGNITYYSLYARVKQLAGYLKYKGIGKGDPVIVCMDRRIDIIVALLAIARMGAAYVPVDPEYPAERISYMITDTGAQLMIAGTNQVRLLESTGVAENIICIERDEVLFNKFGINEEMAFPEPSDTAYIIYTSGSTGQPKGVVIRHANLLNLIHWHISEFDVNSDSRATAMAGVGFDAFGWEVWPYLSAGATVYLISDDERMALPKLLDYFRMEGISHSFVATALVTGFINESLGKPLSLKYLLTGGDRLPLINLENIPYKVINNYGPTENTVVSTFCKMEGGDSGLAMIGKPVSNTKVFILDRHMQPAAIGVTGELYVCGAQVAAGYWKQLALSAEKFLPDHLTGKKNAFLYKTGDRAKWSSDGNILFAGRADDQVKLRGFRIEPGEIEHVLLQAPGIKQAVVQAENMGANEKYLVAYIVAEENVEMLSLRTYLNDRLPAYMVPSVLLGIDAIPLTPNGKTDRKKLSAMSASHRPGSKYEAPRNALEELLVTIWAEVLMLNDIGIHDNFFEMGGHSLMAMRMVSAIRNRTGTDIPVRKIFIYPTIALLSSQLSIEGTEMSLPLITVIPEKGKIPLSFQQERLWFMDKLGQGNQYNIPWVFRLYGTPDIARLNAAFGQIVNRHEILRTVIREVNGVGYQQIVAPDLWKMDIVAAAGPAFVAELLRRPFRLSDDQMLKVTLIQVSPEESILVCVVHHIAFDGWSLGRLVQEFVTFYEGDNSILPPLKIQYSDYAIWQREYISGKILEQGITYWMNQLSGTSPLVLPADRYKKTGPDEEEQGATAASLLNKELTDKLSKLAVQEGVTLFMVLLSAFKALLHRYSGQEDICIGTTIAGRQQASMEELIGFFINTVALRSYVDSNNSFRDLLQQVKRTTLDAYSYQHIPFEKVVEALGTERETGKHPLFQVVFVLENTPASAALEMGDILLVQEDVPVTTSKFDMRFSASYRGDELQLHMIYRRDLYSEELISRMLKHYENVLDAITRDPDISIGSIELLEEKEKQQILSFSGNGPLAYAHDKTWVQIFSEQVISSPDVPALAFEGHYVSYRELDVFSNQLAHYLRLNGIGKGALVPLCMERGPDMIVALLAITKAGAAYVPLDTGNPDDRIANMLAAVSPSLFLVSPDQQLRMDRIIMQHTALHNVSVVSVESAGPVISAQSVLPLSLEIQPDDLAYVIFTSGSTGNPRGVAIRHASVMDYVYGLMDRTQIAQSKSFALVSTLAADLGNTVIYTALLTGGTLHVLSGNMVSDGQKIRDYFEDNAIDCVKIVPSHWKALCNENELLLPRKLLIFGGELLKASFVSEIQNTGYTGRIVNHYGPTETTIGKLLHEVIPGREYQQYIPIGRPFSRTVAYVLNDMGKLCPLGVAGEICIGGAGLAAAYLGQPEWTAARFVPDPVSGIPGAGIYKTGDMGKWLADGNMEYIGRKDDQVKIRGYRVEPGEISRTLETYPGVLQAVTLSPEDNRGDKYLVAFVVLDAEISLEDLGTYLRGRLPDYMVPAVINIIPAIPLTPNGKTDRKKLLQEIILPLTSNEYRAAENETEQLLVSIWEELLEVDNIGVHANFFALGGHSLLAVRMIAAIRSRLEKELPIIAIFDHPTIASLALQLIAMNGREQLPAIRKYERIDPVPLSHSQERLWFIDRLQQGSRQYNMPRMFRLKGTLDVSALNRAFRTITDRHEILRTVIREKDGVPYQLVNPAGTWTINYVRPDDIIAAGLEPEAYMESLLGQPYDLSHGDMLKVTLIKINDKEYLLGLVLHHIAFDGWSLSVLVKELVELYNSRRFKRASSLDTLPVQYADYAIWQRKYLSGDILDKKLAYWKEKLKAVSPLELPLDAVRPAIQSIRGSLRTFTFDGRLQEQLNSFSLKQGVTLFMTLLAGFKVLLSRYTGQDDICVGTPVANRTEGVTEFLIGLFVNTLVLRSDLSGDPDFLSVLQRVKQTALDAYAHQDTPFEKVVEVLAVDRNQTYSPLFQVMFVLQNTPEVKDFNLDGISCIPVTTVHDTSKFDLFFNLVEAAGEIHVQIEYCTDLFTADTIARMFGHYQSLLYAAMSSPADNISRLQMISDSEREVLTRYSTGDIVEDDGTSFLQLFEAQVHGHPDATAVVAGDRKMTYTELNERANFLAYDLIRYGVKEDALVAICVERSIEMVIAVLAVLKAGGAYTPLDVNYPQDRLNYILDDTAASIVLTTRTCGMLLKNSNSRRNIEMEDHLYMWERDEKNPCIKLSHKALAYVIYTSGSTGMPKGVGLTVKGLSNLIKWQFTQQGAGTGYRVLQFASLSFDVSFQEIFSTLCAGRTLFLIEDERRKDMQALLSDISKQKITTLFVPFVVLKNIAEYAKEFNDYPQSLHEIFTAGEQLKLTPDIHAFMQGTGAVLYNQYGPSEAHVVSAYKIQEADYRSRVLPPIGAPVNNTQLYILDKNGNACGIGIPGMLYIGGIQVGRGYLNNPGLTTARFVADHFSGKEAATMYCTGDKARWLPDGNIEFLGRIDDQVKIRGYRIELGEVEAVLQQAENIKNVVVVAREDSSGSKRLVAYVTTDVELDRTVLQQYMKAHLPDYMIPGIIMPVERIPVTANGKADKRRLPDVELHLKSGSEYEGPRNQTEEEIIRIWQQLLSLTKIGIHDNFFEVGGHSLLVTRLAAAIRTTFDIEMAVSIFFQLSTPAAIAAYIDVHGAKAAYDADKYEAIKL